MSLSIDSYYLITCHNRLGSILRQVGNNILDIENGTCEVLNKSIKSSCVKIPNDKVNYIIEIKKSERIYAIEMILTSGNLYHSKSTSKQLSGRNLIIRYFLIKENYKAWPKGSIFEVADKTIYECDMKNGGIMNEPIPPSWIEITVDDKKILISKKRKQRIGLYNIRKSTETLRPTSSIPLTDDKRSNEKIAEKSIVSLPSSIVLPPKTEYYESIIIIPSSVREIKAMAFSEFTVGDKVDFTLNKKGSCYQGTLKWLGLVNGIKTAAVQFVSSRPYDPLIMLQCPLTLNLQMNILDLTRVVLVKVSNLNKHVKKHDVMTKYFTTMYSCLDDPSLASRIFDDAEELNDQAFLDSLVSNCPVSFISRLCLKLMSTLTDNSNKLKNVTLLINKMAISKNGGLLEIAKVCLTSKKNDLFKLTINKCNDRNSYLDNGETFLTDLIKNQVDEGIITLAIGTKLFDINRPNNEDDSPLTLACGRILVTTVRLLVDLGCNIGHNNGKALDIAFAAKRTAMDMDRLKNVIEVIEILSIATKPDINICSICMDKKLNTVFNCGHNSCRDCADKLVVCHFCKKEIVNRITLFLA